MLKTLHTITVNKTLKSNKRTKIQLYVLAVKSNQLHRQAYDWQALHVLLWLPAKPSALNTIVLLFPFEIGYTVYYHNDVEAFSWWSRDCKLKNPWTILTNRLNVVARMFHVALPLDKYINSEIDHDERLINNKARQLSYIDYTIYCNKFNLSFNVGFCSFPCYFVVFISYVLARYYIYRANRRSLKMVIENRTEFMYPFTAATRHRQSYLDM